ncbi:MAG: PAS domain S-box protein [Polyangia bacterium]
MNQAQLATFDLIAAWAVVIDGQGRIVRPNQACAEALGYSVSELLGELFWEKLADASDRQRVRETVVRLREQDETTAAFESRVPSRAGSQLWVAWTVRRAAPLEATGEASWIATGVDRTEWKRAEEELAWSERIVASSEDAIVSSSPQGIIRTWNPAAVRMFGFTAQEAIGRPATIIYPEGNTEDRAMVIARMMRGEIVTEYDTLRRRKDGTVFPVAMTGSLIRGRDGQLLGVLGIARDITEAKRAQEAQAWLANIVNSSSDAIVGTDTEGVIRSWNSAAERIYGYTAAEMIGRSGEILYPDERLAERRELLAALRAGRSMVIETARRHRDGSLIPVQLTTSPLRDGDGRVVGTSSIVRDLRERNELRARLDEERRWLRQVIDSAPVGVVLVDAAQRVNANRAAERILGLRLDPERGRARCQASLSRVDGTPLTEAHLFDLPPADARPGLGSSEVQVAHPDGSTLVTVANAARVLDAEQRVLGRVLVFTDVTALKRTQREREELAATLERLIDVMPVGIWVANASGEITRTNATGQQIWEGTPARYDAFQVLHVESGEPVPLARWPLVRALREGETVRGEVVRIRSFGGREKTVLVAATPLFDKDGHVAGAVLVNEDITSLREVEEKLRRAVRSREEILGVVAHDLRSPLNAIGLWAKSIQRALARGRDVDPKAAEQILRAVARMDRLIADLLDIVRLDAGTLAIRRGRVVPAELLAELLVSQTALAAAASVELTIEPAESLQVLWADRDRLLQVLENLVGNAVKFTPAGGRITVGAKVQDSEVLLWVTDTGKGVSAEQLPHLFDRFWQADRSDRRGAGLGLAIVKGLVEAHGGRIWAESNVGEGTTVSFTVPLASAPQG